MVPLTMPRTRLTWSPASDSRSGRSIGMAPATRPRSRGRRRPARRPRAGSAPSSASSALLAVTTDLPLDRAAAISVRAGSMPPMTSMTMSMSSRVTSDSASVVSSAGSTSTSRVRPRRRTAMPASSSGAPDRAARSSPCSWMQPDDLRADHPAAQQGHLQRLVGSFRHVVLARPRPGEQVVLGLAAARCTRASPSATATTAGAGRSCSCSPSTGSTRRSPAPRSGRPARRRRAGTRRAR